MISQKGSWSKYTFSLFNVATKVKKSFMVLHWNCCAYQAIYSVLKLKNYVSVKDVYSFVTIFYLMVFTQNDDKYDLSGFRFQPG